MQQGRTLECTMLNFLSILAPVVGFGALAIASLRWGAESRHGFGDELTTHLR